MTTASQDAQDVRKPASNACEATTYASNMVATLGEITLTLPLTSLLISRKRRQPQGLRPRQNRVRLQRKPALGTNRSKPDVPGRNSGVEQSVRPRFIRCPRSRARKGLHQQNTTTATAYDTIASSNAARLGSVVAAYYYLSPTSATATFISWPFCASSSYTRELGSCRFT